ncbi:MAG: hypothetical protein AAF975_07020, partial [Spirochaetota bacterium]
AIKAHAAIGCSPKHDRHPYKQHIYVATGNNHHVQIFVRPDGKAEEFMCSFWEVVQRYKKGLPIFEAVPEGCQLLQRLQKGQLYLVGFTQLQQDWPNWDRGKQAKVLGPHLYRVAKLSSSDYCFMRHNIAGSFDKIEQNGGRIAANFEWVDKSTGKTCRTPEGLRLTSLKTLEKLQLTEVRISPDGRLSRVPRG